MIEIMLLKFFWTYQINHAIENHTMENHVRRGLTVNTSAYHDDDLILTSLIQEPSQALIISAGLMKLWHVAELYLLEFEFFLFIL